MTTIPKTGINADPELHEFVWNSGHLTIGIGIAFTPDIHIFDHLGITTLEPEKAPLPITSTGYKSHYVGKGMVAEYGGPVAAVRLLLDKAAASADWQEYLKSSRQGCLF